MIKWTKMTVFCGMPDKKMEPEFPVSDFIQFPHIEINQ